MPADLVPTFAVRVSGDTVHFTLQVSNAGDTTVVLEFGTAQRYDFLVRDGGGGEVWRWSAEQMFAQVVGEEAIPAGGSVVYRGAWVAAGGGGRYVGEARLVSTSHPVALSSEFEVTGGGGRG